MPTSRYPPPVPTGSFHDGDFSAELEPGTGYLLVVEHGQLGSADAMVAYLDEVERHAQRAGVERALFDARQDPPPTRGDESVGLARWDYWADKTRLSAIAVLFKSEIAEARVNMTARARRVNVRAFLDRTAAEEWLAGS